MGIRMCTMCPCRKYAADGVDHLGHEPKFVSSPSVTGFIANSSRNDGTLTFRLEAGDRSISPLLDAMVAAGFKAGDRMTIVKYESRRVPIIPKVETPVVAPRFKRKPR